MKRSSFHNEDSLLIFGSLEDLVHPAGSLSAKYPSTLVTSTVPQIFGNAHCLGCPREVLELLDGFLGQIAMTV
jgi:hypothetical protein